MHFLIDENLPRSIESVFEDLDFEVEHVRDIKQLRGYSDEVVFKYAVTYKRIIVTRDLNFANPIRFNLGDLPGIVVLRFPNDVSIAAICRETARLCRLFKNEDWHNIVILEPGSARLRKR